jgi:yecA family protein
MNIKIHPKSKSNSLWSDFKECSPYDIQVKDLMRLDDFLRDNNLPGGCNSLTMADGFLTALVVGPHSIQRHHKQGLEVVWGDIGMNARNEKSRLESEMATILCERMGNIYYQLEHDRNAYCPLIHHPYVESAKPEKNKLPPTIEWCRGFMYYFGMKPDAWNSILIAKRDCQLMGPIIHFGTEMNRQWQGLLIDGNCTILDTFAERIPHYVFGIKDHFETPYFVEDMTDFLVAYARWSHR